MRVWIAGALLLAACSQAQPDPSVVTSDEDRQLNDAAASLEANAIAPAEDNTQ